MQEGEEFAAAADAYVRRFVQKGIPSLFTNLKSLYSDAAKATALGELFDRMLASVETDKTLPALVISPTVRHDLDPNIDQVAPDCQNSIMCSSMTFCTE